LATSIVDTRLQSLRRASFEQLNAVAVDFDRITVRHSSAGDKRLAFETHKPFDNSRFKGKHDTRGSATGTAATGKPRSDHFRRRLNGTTFQFLRFIAVVG
jgi:hypothetical protein